MYEICYHAFLYQMDQYCKDILSNNHDMEAENEFLDP